MGPSTLPAMFVYGIARRLGAQPAGAAAWAGGYLAFPAVGQLNLSMTYGMHEVTLALPTVMAALWAVLSRRHVLALADQATQDAMEAFWRRRALGRSPPIAEPKAFPRP